MVRNRALLEVLLQCNFGVYGAGSVFGLALLAASMSVCIKVSSWSGGGLTVSFGSGGHCVARLPMFEQCDDTANEVYVCPISSWHGRVSS